MFSYNNAAFVVLGRIVESLTGATWHAALRSRLLDPIGADHTVTLPEEALLFNTSPGHTVSPTTFEINLARPWVLPHAMAACGATPCATAGDLLKFARLHLDRGAAPDGTRILSEASVAAMQQPQVDLARGPGYGANHWGLGWMLFDWGGQRRDARVIGHDGGTIGQSSSLRILPEERFAVAVLTNSVSGSLLTNRVMRWLFDEIFGVDMPPRPMPPESPADIDLTPYVGVYERIGFRTTITLQDGHLISKTEVLAPMAENEPQFPAAQMFALEEGLFLQRDPTGVFVSVTFSDFHDGKPRYLHAGRVARRAE